MFDLPTHPRSVAPLLPTYPYTLDTDPPESLASENAADLQFLELLNAYRAIGGLARASEVFTMFRSRNEPDATSLARAMVKRQIICFDWQSTTWIPLFQFERAGMVLHLELEPVLCELRPVFDAWEIASWFVQENGWLADRAPAELLVCSPAVVLNAARADRFIAA